MVASRDHYYYSIVGVIKFSALFIAIFAHFVSMHAPCEGMLIHVYNQQQYYLYMYVQDDFVLIYHQHLKHFRGDQTPPSQVLQCQLCLSADSAFIRLRLGQDRSLICQ